MFFSNKNEHFASVYLLISSHKIAIKVEEINFLKKLCKPEWSIVVHISLVSDSCLIGRNVIKALIDQTDFEEGVLVSTVESHFNIPMYKNLFSTDFELVSDVQSYF